MILFTYNSKEKLLAVKELVNHNTTLDNLVQLSVRKCVRSGVPTSVSVVFKKEWIFNVLCGPVIVVVVVVAGFPPPPQSDLWGRQTEVNNSVINSSNNTSRKKELLTQEVLAGGVEYVCE
ncbi:hypothetical protein Pcinc_028901 [Petrolisthes cinctipes]|uniref:Uncharacterized protein n=1 Tax=Petrolisthes cinctipes TaxID=88211 RepID=A0AAE1K4R8_PETCI|nr:hypothetical protein Pcinc_028901 [Petrolisthes cinctipes]